MCVAVWQGGGSWGWAASSCVCLLKCLRPPCDCHCTCAQTGTNFGPETSTLPVPTSISFFFGSSSPSGVVTTPYSGPCVVSTNFTSLNCTSPRGVGSGHLLWVVVGGQASAPVGPFAYLAPSITSFTPAIGPGTPGSVVNFVGECKPRHADQVRRCFTLVDVAYSLLLVAACCCLLLLVAACCCLLLLVAACCCLLLLAAAALPAAAAVASTDDYVPWLLCVVA